MSFTNGDDEDSLDGELVYRVLQLMNLTDSRLPQVNLLSNTVSSSAKLRNEPHRNS